MNSFKRDIKDAFFLMSKAFRQLKDNIGQIAVLAMPCLILFIFMKCINHIYYKPMSPEGHVVDFIADHYIGFLIYVVLPSLLFGLYFSKAMRMLFLLFCEGSLSSFGFDLIKFKKVDWRFVITAAYFWFTVMMIALTFEVLFMDWLITFVAQTAKNILDISLGAYGPYVLSFTALFFMDVLVLLFSLSFALILPARAMGFKLKDKEIYQALNGYIRKYIGVFIFFVIALDLVFLSFDTIFTLVGPMVPAFVISFVYTAILFFYWLVCASVVSLVYKSVLVDYLHLRDAEHLGGGEGYE